MVSLVGHPRARLDTWTVRRWRTTWTTTDSPWTACSCPPPAPHPTTSRPPLDPPEQQPTTTVLHMDAHMRRNQATPETPTGADRGAGAEPLRGRQPVALQLETGGEATACPEPRQWCHPEPLPDEPAFQLYQQQRRPCQALPSPPFLPLSTPSFFTPQSPTTSKPPTYGGHPSRSGAGAL